MAVDARNRQALGEVVDVRTFGAVGDGIADDTVAFQAALDFAHDYRKVVYAGSGIYRITAQLTLEGPGLVFDECTWGWDGQNDAGILVTGTESAYTALRVVGRPEALVVTVYAKDADRNANGVLFHNCQSANVQHVRVRNLDGYGVRIEGCWDCLFGTISVEQCGNSGTYAFSIGEYTEDTYVFDTNMTHIVRLQVEKSSGGAIEVKESTLCCVIDNIHSEENTPADNTATWVLGGNRCLYNSVRLGRTEATTGPVAKVKLCGNQVQFNALVVEGTVDFSVAHARPIVTELQPTDSGSTMVLVDPELAGTTRVAAENSGTVCIYGGVIGYLNSGTGRYRVYGTVIPYADLDGAASPLDSVFDGCKFVALNITSIAAGVRRNVALTDCHIGALTFSSVPDADSVVLDGCVVDVLTASPVNGPAAVAAATFVNCTIMECGSSGGPSLLGITVLHGTTVKSSYTIQVAYRTVFAYHSYFDANVNIDTGSIQAFGTKFHGDISQSAGALASIFDDGCVAQGTVSSGNGMPTTGWWARGTRTKNLAPASGQPRGWICTASGTPGTWQSEGNLP